jgi:hypothetical protein
MRQVLSFPRAVIALSAIAASALIAAGAASADTVVETHTPEAGVIVLNPCTGETVVFSGYITGRFTVNVDDHILGSASANLENFQGVSASGATYVMENSGVFTQVGTLPGYLPLSVTQTGMLHIIRQQPVVSMAADDFYMQFTVHFTLNENGEVTASQSEATTECK